MFEIQWELECTCPCRGEKKGNDTFWMGWMADSSHGHQYLQSVLSQEPLFHNLLLTNIAAIQCGTPHSSAS